MTDTDLMVGASPVFEIDDEIVGSLARDLNRLEIDEGTDGLKTLRARFVAFGPPEVGEEPELLYLDGSVLDFGKRLKVSIGPPEAARFVFDGFLSRLEACFREGQEPEVVVAAEDRFMDLRMTRRMRTYEEMSDADIAEEIANEHGLSSQADADGPTYDVVQQWNMSDLAFLRERGRLIQAEPWVQDDTLHFKSRSRRSAPELTLVRGNELMAVELAADLAHQRTAVQVTGFDASAREVIDEEAAADVLAGEVAAGRSGPEVLDAAFGERRSFRVREVPLTGEEAAEWARQEMLRRSRSFVKVRGTSQGSGDMVVGSQLRLERVGSPFEGEGYYATRVRHTFDSERGFRTHFEAERATVGAA